jgi:NADPH-dependent F420 reductase
MSTLPRVAIIGAGNVGGGLGMRFSNAGVPVHFGVRAGSEVKALKECAKDTQASDISAAVAWADVVFITVPGPVAVEVVRSLAEELKGKVVVDCNNPLKWQDGPVWNPPAEGSLAAAMAKAAPGARIVKGFNHFGAEFHKDPSVKGVPAQVFLAGDDHAAKQQVSQVANAAGFQAVDAGPLRNAAVLENLAVLWIHLAIAAGHGRSFTLMMNGR